MFMYEISKMKISKNNIIKYVLPIIFIFLLIASLVPVLRLAGYDYATGDDLGYGAKTHLAWANGHSIRLLLIAIKENVIQVYNSWQGTWFTVVLMSLQPEVFCYGTYFITPYIMIGIVISATTLIVWTLGKQIVGLSVWAWVSIDVLIVLTMIQYFPSTASGIYWFNGGAHYIIPYGIAMITLWALFTYRREHRISYFVVVTIGMTLLGGASYLMPLLILLILFYWFIFDLWMWNRERTNTIAQMWIMIIPTILELAGLYISFLSPGNKNRGGENFGISFEAIVIAIFESFKQACESLMLYMKECPIIYIVFILIAIICLSDFEIIDAKKVKFKLPGLFALAMFCLYAAMYAPGVYAGVEVSGGVPNTIFQMFLLTTSASIVYFCGWISIKVGNLNMKRIHVFLQCIFVFSMFLLMFFGRNTIKNSTAYEAWEYKKSGRADDFKAQMEYNRTQLLDSNIEDCYLCPINPDQGPLMHMPVVEDEENFTNSVNRNFYGKRKVVVDPNINIQAD